MQPRVKLAFKARYARVDRFAKIPGRGCDQSGASRQNTHPPLLTAALSGGELASVGLAP